MKQPRMIRVWLLAGRAARKFHWRKQIVSIVANLLERDERKSGDDSASPLSGIGFSFATIQEPLSSQQDGFRMHYDSGPSRHFIDERLMEGVE